MNAFSLHILDGAHWRYLERFADRDSAMVVASRIRNAGEYPGVKILESVTDQTTLKDKDKIVYAWTTKGKERESYENTDDYMERIKRSRIRKEKKDQIEKMERRKRIRNSCVSASVVCVFLAGVYVLYLLKNS